MEHLDTTMMVVIILLLALIFVLFCLTILLGIHILKKNDKTLPPKPDLVEGKTTPITIDQTVNKTGFCNIHSLSKSAGLCAVCEKEFCEVCISQIDKVNLCPEHLQTYIANEWESITNQKTSGDNPESAVYIYDFKHALWNDQKIPSYIMNDYKIHVEEDYIETYVMLYVPKDKASSLKSKISNFKESVGKEHVH